MSAQLHATATIASATTTALIAAPQAKSRIVVDSINVAVGTTATKVTLQFSSGNQKVYELPTNGDIQTGALRWEGDAAAALSVITSAAGPTDVNVDYHLEAAEQ